METASEFKVTTGKRGKNRNAKLVPFIVDFDMLPHVVGVAALDRFEAVEMACAKLRIVFKPKWTVLPIVRHGKVRFVRVVDAEKPPPSNRGVTSGEEEELDPPSVQAESGEVGWVTVQSGRCANCGGTFPLDSMNRKIESWEAEAGGVATLLCNGCYVPF